MADIRHRRLGEDTWTLVADAALPLSLPGYAAGETVEIQSRDWSATRTVAIPVAAVAAPTAAGALPDLQLGVNESFSVPTAGDFTGQDLAFSLQAGPAWMSVDPVSGLASGIAPAAAVTVAAVVRASNAAGHADSGFSVEVAGAALGAVTVDSASVALPTANIQPGAANANATYYRVPRPMNLFPTGYTSGVFFLRCEIPWDKLADDDGALYYGLFGNYSAGSSLQTIGARIDGANAATPGRIVVYFHTTATHYLTIPIGAYSDVAGTSKGMLAIWHGDADPSGEIYAAWFPADGSTAIGKDTETGVTGSALRGDILVGANGDFNASPLAPYTGFSDTGAFPGHVGMFGAYLGDVTEADLQLIASGANPGDVLTGGTWAACYEFDDPTETSVPDVLGIRADATLVTGSNGAAARGGDTAGAYDAGTVFAVDAVPDGFVWGRKPGDATGTITLTGSAVGLSGGVEIRCANASDGQLVLDWTAATITSGSLAGGTWTAEVACPPNTGWGVIDVRPAAAPGMVQRIRQRCGVGTVALALGQSQMNIATRAYIGIKTDYVNAGAVSVVRRPAGVPGAATQIAPVDQNVFQLADFFGGAADYLGTLDAEPVMFLAEHISGTGIDQLLDDSLAARDWSDLSAMVAKGGGASNVTTTVLQWGTNFMSSADIQGSHVAPLYEGVQPDDASYTNDHGLAGILDAGVVHALSPLTRHTAASDTAGYTGNAGECRAEEIAYAQANGFAIGPFCDDYPTGDGAAQDYGPHPYQSTQESNARLGGRVMAAVMRAAGVDASVNPTLGTPVRSGAAITVPATLPNGGSLQTYWGFNSLTPPAGALSVSGFEVLEPSGSWSYGESGASVEFTAEISGSNVVLTRASGSWAAGTSVRYLANGPISFTGLTAAQGNERLRGMLYESGAQEGGLGLPVSGLWSGTAA